MKLKLSDSFQFFFCPFFSWITNQSGEANWDIHGTLIDAVRSGATDWFEHVQKTNSENHETDEDILQHVVKIIQLIRSDLQRGIEYYDKAFLE